MTYKSNESLKKIYLHCFEKKTGHIFCGMTAYQANINKIHKYYILTNNVY